MTYEIMKISDQAVKVADKFLSKIVTPLFKPSLEESGELTRDKDLPPLAGTANRMA